jgi:hypothetical protein
VKRLSLIVLIAVLALAQPASAQRRGGSSQPSRAELERRLREDFEERVRERLGLTEEQARNLSNAVLEFQQERLDLQRRESALRQRLERQGTGRRGGALLADDQARDVLREMRALQNDETSLFNREHDRLLELLTPGQLVSYYLLREQFAESLRRVRGSERS